MVWGGRSRRRIRITDQECPYHIGSKGDSIATSATGLEDSVTTEIDVTATPERVFQAIAKIPLPR